MKEKSRPTPSLLARKGARVGYVIAALVVVVVIVLFNQEGAKGPKTNTHTTSQLPATVTPEVFQNFIGPVTQVGTSSLAVRMTIVRPGGTQLERDYEVKVGPTTDLSIYYDRAEGASFKPAAFSDFASGDRVIVYGQENLYTLTSFTAVKVYKIAP